MKGVRRTVQNRGGAIVLVHVFGKVDPFSYLLPALPLHFGEVTHRPTRSDLWGEKNMAAHAN